MEQKKQISVIMTVFNQFSLTERCLNSLLENTETAQELIVLDNNSTDDTVERIESEFKDRFCEKGWSFQLVRNGDNLGFGRAMNKGVRMAEGQYVALLNNDTWIAPGWEFSLPKRIKELDAIAVFPYMYEKPFDEVTTPVFAKAFMQKNAGKKRVDWRGAMMFFDKELLTDIGLFDERFFLTYEDTDLRERITRAKMKYYTVGDSFIWHFVKGTRLDKRVPSNHEIEGHRLFMEKWGFDPREREKSRFAKLERKLKKIRYHFDIF